MTHRESFPDTITPSRNTQIRRSALWAAYGDALGWISELTNVEGLKRRTKGSPLCRPIEWTRRIGGRAGVTALLPQGCYSDDSQLRLATSRAIRPDGFDVQAFAKVELPIWLSYALGGGKSTSAAAAELAKTKVTWYANTFKNWTKSGGNGAAMRIQPHVWAARTPNKVESFITDVVRNTVCTHSHPHGLMGAVLHALVLAHTMTTDQCPSPDVLLVLTDVAANLPDMIQSDIEVGRYWRANFEQNSGSFDKAWKQAIAETTELIHVASNNPSNATGQNRYLEIIDHLSLRDPSRRGSGMLTALAAVGLIWCETRPEEALRIAANTIGTDTDTIATMAGAILGILAKEDPPVEVLDADLFRSESDRLAKIAHGEQPQSHRYPDLLHWSAPKTRADMLTRLQDGDFYVRGLGRVVKTLDNPIQASQGDFQWQWIKLEFGQTLLIKRRKDIPHCVEEHEKFSEKTIMFPNTPEGRSQPDLPKSHEAGPEGQRVIEKTAAELRSQDTATPNTISETSPRSSQDKELDLPQALAFLAEYKDDDEKVGKALRRVVNKGTTGEIAAFTAALIDHIREPKQAK